ncbi:MAG: hypothetical protein ACRDTG_02085 [Pseudonocardiaceae bacterium]
MTMTTPHPDLPGINTPTAKRFFTLRESGWTGWIDQDGYTVEDLNQWLAQHNLTTFNTTRASERDEVDETARIDSEDYTINLDQWLNDQALAKPLNEPAIA